MDNELTPLALLGLIMFFSFAAGLAVERVGIPRVAVYVAVGAVFSESLVGQWLPYSLESWSPALTDVALAVIAYLVGAEIHLKEVHRQEKSVFAGAIGQLFAVWALVAAGVWLYSQWLGDDMRLSAAIVLGSIATATAPAAVIAVMEEYKARGKVSGILLGVVAIDDAFGIIAFTVALGAVGAVGIEAGLADAGREIFGALLMGSLIGAGLGVLGRRIHEEDLRLPLVIAAIFLAAGLAQHFEVSMLLTCMSVGLVSKILFKGKTEQWLGPINHIREVIFLIFFVLAGLHFQPGVFVQSLGLILVYILARSAGKVGGAALGTSIAGAPTKVRKYLGICMLPQAGVALGLTLKAEQHQELQEIGATLMNIVLGSTIVFELTAPIAARWALDRSGELQGGQSNAQDSDRRG